MVSFDKVSPIPEIASCTRLYMSCGVSSRVEENISTMVSLSSIISENIPLILTSMSPALYPKNTKSLTISAKTPAGAPMPKDPIEIPPSSAKPIPACNTLDRLSIIKSLMLNSKSRSPSHTNAAYSSIWSML